MWTRQELKFRGKQAIQRNYGCAVGVALIVTITSGWLDGGGTMHQYTTRKHGGSYYSYSAGSFHWSDVGGIMSGMLVGLVGLIALAVAFGILLFGIFAGNVLAVGGCRFFVLNQTGRPGMGAMLDGFRSGHYSNLVLTMFLRGLYIFLWSLLLVIPGIVKHYEYLMIPYILAENPGMDRNEAFLISKQMMMGQKMDTFVLDLSFIGWAFLSTLTCGLLGIFYVNPYREATFAELYTVNRAEAYQAGYIK